MRFTYYNLLEWLQNEAQHNPQRMSQQVIVVVSRVVVIPIDHGALINRHEAKHLGLSDHQLILCGNPNDIPTEH